MLKLWIIKALLGREAIPLGLFFRRLGDLYVHLFKRLHLIFSGAVIKLNRNVVWAVRLGLSHLANLRAFGGVKTLLEPLRRIPSPHSLEVCIRFRSELDYNEIRRQFSAQ